MIAITDKELVNYKTIVNCRYEYTNEQYKHCISKLQDRQKYLYPLITELAKKGISLKDICIDLYYEYLNICVLIEIDKKYN